MQLFATLSNFFRCESEFTYIIVGTSVNFVSFHFLYDLYCHCAIILTLFRLAVSSTRSAVL
jgi:hypothetical protein